ncbi:MAG: hypothetical protein MUF18_21990 [Fimbriiglobus sp.]|jgi:hypothetical protein|nr:hypothetical protein [Fimbriiglobus sp.]
MNCCFRAKHREIITVGPGETFEYHVSLTVHRPGSFEAGIDLFLEENGIRTVELTVRGTCVGNGHDDD